MIKVSVVIPVYKVEKYIERCARSLFEQTLEDIEFIFVDDCSPDQSIEVLERVIQDYPNRKNRIRVIHHPENKGLSTARNSGLKIAEGRYIAHCDSDDWVERDMYEKMYEKAIITEAEIVVCDFYMEYLNGNEYNKQKDIENSEDFLKAGLKGDIFCYVWNKLIKRDLYEKNRIYFLDGINMWEDLIAFVQYFYYGRKIAYVEKACYHYLKCSTNSIVHQMTRRQADERVKVCLWIENFLKENGVWDVYCLDFICLAMNAKINFIVVKNIKDNAYWNSLWPEFNKYIWKIDKRWDIRLMYWLASKKAYALVYMIFHAKEKINYILH